ncbi:MAG: vanadium-dependent haloperoxidase [Bacteroidota bacterium]
MRSFSLAACLAALVLLPSCQRAPATYTAADQAIVTEWMNNLYGLVRVERYSPPKAARVFSYTAVTMYEAMNPGLPALKSFVGQLTELDALPQPDPEATYDWLTVAIAAQQTVVTYLFDGASPPSQAQIQQLAEVQHASRTEAGFSQAVLDRSKAHGETLGAALVEWMRGDGFHERDTIEYDHIAKYTGPQCWLPTANSAQNVPMMASPATDFVSLDNSTGLDPSMASERMLLVNRPDSWLNPHSPLEPNWGGLRPLVIPQANVCAPPPPVEYSEEQGSAFYQEVKAVYDKSQDLSAEEIEVARYWADCPGQTGTPPGHWVQIMRQLVEQYELDMEQTIEMYGLTGIGLQDAFISCWEEKYRSNLVRPITYIQEMWDPNWQTVVVTPPFPEYTSGHSVVSGTAAQLLTHLFGDRPFVDRTHAWLGFGDRSFDSFNEAAIEAADSRLYGGIHYPMAIDLGIDQGRCVANNIIGAVQTR